MTDIESARTCWIADRSAYEAFGEMVLLRLRASLKGLGIWHKASARSKELDSLIKKLIVKPHYTYESLPDKVGIRVVVRYIADISKVCAAARDLFCISCHDDKDQGIDRVGYQSLHLDGVRLHEDDNCSRQYPPSSFWCELQVRTLAQDLWAEMSHDTIYKNDAMMQALPTDPRRRIHLMAGQVEIADREFDRLHSELAEVEGVRIFDMLEHHFYVLTSSSKPPNSELSMQVIRAFMKLYPGTESDIADMINDFLTEKGYVLEQVYAQAGEAGLENTTAFLFQPEVLMIYERLTNEKERTRRLWNASYHERELERIANAFGISFD